MSESYTLDKEIQGFIQQTLNFYPADAVDASVAQQRQWYDALCAAYRQPRPAALRVSDSLVMGKDGHQIPIRTYQIGAEVSQQQVLYAHGGGFVVGDLDSHDDVCAEIASRCQVDVVSVDYRLAPEYHYPQDLNDCLAVLDGLLAKGHQLVLAGDSAGGALSACVANSRLEACGTGIIGQVLIYPSLAKDWTTASMITHANAPMLTKADMEYYLPLRTNGEPSPFDDPGFVALANTDLSGLPPTHLFPAEVDPLCDDCELYAQALQAVGVEAVNHLEVGQGLVHGHLRARNVSSKAKANFDGICASITQLLARP
jgi:acetyl esterase